MGKRSVKENKTAYQLAREAAGLTREKAAEQLVFVSEDRIEKIEAGRSLPHPDEVLAMAAAYRAPTLNNYYCSHECPIGQRYVPELQQKELSQIVLDVISGLNTLQSQKDRLVDITVDGIIEKSELEDFEAIRGTLAGLSASAGTLQIWLEKAIDEGRVENENS